ncbi:conserved hypothetical protein [Ralstonia solanacearum K60]|nr:conserved hypothetical protein [Ralstonia solanacearum K60]
MRGEHDADTRRWRNKHGSSPHARGTLELEEAAIDWARFIPACAGNTVLPKIGADSGTVHPRMRGEH